MAGVASQTAAAAAVPARQADPVGVARTAALAHPATTSQGGRTGWYTAGLIQFRTVGATRPRLGLCQCVRACGGCSAERMTVFPATN